MLDLSACGLPITFDEKEKKLVGKVSTGEKGVRTFEDMESVLSNPVKRINELYYMFRNVGDDSFGSIRYDITVIVPGTIGGEFVKTKGHYHPDNFPEVYEVIKGRAYYLLQKSSEPYETVDDVIIVEAKEGDKVVIPPLYGHITINPESEFLVMSNLVSKKFSSIYEPYMRFKGGAYYFTDKGTTQNENYDKLPDLRRALPREVEEFGLSKKRPLYRSILEEREKFEFLNEGKAYDFSHVLEIV